MTVQLSFRVEGMTCANCSGRVERVLKRLDGVDQVNVNLATEKANVVVGDGGPDIEEMGYEEAVSRSVRWIEAFHPQSQT